MSFAQIAIKYLDYKPSVDTIFMYTILINIKHLVAITLQALLCKGHLYVPGITIYVCIVILNSTVMSAQNRRTFRQKPAVDPATWACVHIPCYPFFAIGRRFGMFMGNDEKLDKTFPASWKSHAPDSHCGFLHICCSQPIWLVQDVSSDRPPTSSY